MPLLREISTTTSYPSSLLNLSGSKDCILVIIHLTDNIHYKWICTIFIFLHLGYLSCIHFPINLMVINSVSQDGYLLRDSIWGLVMGIWNKNYSSCYFIPSCSTPQSFEMLLFFHILLLSNNNIYLVHPCFHPDCRLYSRSTLFNFCLKMFYSSRV